MKGSPGASSSAFAISVLDPLAELADPDRHVDLVLLQPLDDPGGIAALRLTVTELRR